MDRVCRTQSRPLRNRQCAPVNLHQSAILTRRILAELHDRHRPGRNFTVRQDGTPKRGSGEKSLRAMFGARGRGKQKPFPRVLLETSLTQAFVNDQKKGLAG